MQNGILWFDSALKKNFEPAVQEAVTYYSKKFGQSPQVAYVHPSMLAAGMSIVGGLSVRPLKYVLPSHLWLGMDEA